MPLVVDSISLVFSPGTIFTTQALSEMGFELRLGEVVGLIGHTGSGKSSLLQVLAGLQKPSSGQVVLDGMPLYQKDTDRRRLHRLVGVSFQYPEHQLFEETVQREIAFGLRRQGLSEDVITERTLEAMALVHLDTSLLTRSPFELSGGQMRRLALAATFALKPEYLFLDEPVAGLDPHGREEILACIAAYRQNNRAAIIFVSHSMEDVARIADRLLVLKRGALLLDSTPAAAFAQEELLQEAGLELPEAYRLMQQLRQRSLKLPDVPVLDNETAYRILYDYLSKKSVKQ